MDQSTWLLSKLPLVLKACSCSPWIQPLLPWTLQVCYMGFTNNKSGMQFSSRSRFF